VGLALAYFQFRKGMPALISSVFHPILGDKVHEQNPDILIMDGPPTLFLGWRFSIQNLADASDNLLSIIEKTNCKVLLDHHLLRDFHYKKRFAKPYQKHGQSISTFAEYLNKENNTLEAHRKQLWEKEKR
ncbi:MAG: hypothetical protein R6U21_05850, partial [Thermoplasmatota archaeon]